MPALPQIPKSPVYFPTQVFVVDDDSSFLENFGFALRDHYHYRLFDSPHTALDCIGMVNSQEQIIDQCFDTDDEMAFVTQTTHLQLENIDPVKLMAGKIDLTDMMYAPRRFSQPSVVIVDYSMPEMNGIEFCQHIENPFIKKILLTGQMQDQLALQAFNEKQIDCYLKKGDIESIPYVFEAIKRLQINYFEDVFGSLQEVLIAPFDNHYFRRKKVLNYIHELMEQHAIKEYYMVENPNGLILVKENGRRQLLVIQDDADLEFHIEVADYQKAPQELIEAIKTKQYVPCFPTQDSRFWSSNDLQQTWQQYLYPCVMVQDEGKQYYCALTPIHEQFDGDMYSYSRYLKQFYECCEDV